MTAAPPTRRSVPRRIAALARLTRWPEHVLFTIPATLLGVDLALAPHPGAAPDGRALLVLAANALAVTFAFMVNDLEDAPDDARDPLRRARNAAACGAIARREGWLAAAAVALGALALFACVNGLTFATGALTLALGLLYSWRAVRLKARPVVDVIAHLLMLSVLLFLAGHFAYSAAPGRAWIAAAGVGLISAYGQLYNQVRDEALDRAAGLRNTTALLGTRRARGLMVACLAGGAACLGATAALGLWPRWLALAALALAPLALIFRRATDMRGSRAIDASGRLQTGAMVVATLVLLIWLAALAAR